MTRFLPAPDIAQRLRDTREETRRREQLTADLTAQGVQIIDRPQQLLGGKVRRLSDLRPSPDTEPGTDLTLEDHASCPGHAAFLSERSWGPITERVTAVWVCTDFQAYGHAQRHPDLDVGANAKVTGPMTNEQKAQRREVITNNKAWDSATTVRRDWLRAFCARSTAPKDAARWIARTLAQGGYDLRKAMESDHPLAIELLGLTTTHRGYPRTERHGIATMAAEASPGRATMITVAMLLAAVETGTDRHTWRRPTPQQAAYFEQLRGWGYSLSEVEMLVGAAEESNRDASDTPAGNPEHAAHLKGQDNAAVDGSDRDATA